MTGCFANTEVAALHIFYVAFILIGFTVYQLKMLSQMGFKTTDDKKQ